MNKAETVVKNFVDNMGLSEYEHDNYLQKFMSVLQKKYL